MNSIFRWLGNSLDNKASKLGSKNKNYSSKDGKTNLVKSLGVGIVISLPIKPELIWIDYKAI